MGFRAGLFLDGLNNKEIKERSRPSGNRSKDMKNILRASIVLNALLVGIVVWQVQRGHGIRDSRSQAGEVERPRVEAQKAPVLRVESMSLAPAFRWSQLESSDYRKYIANLRGIGCPEQTIRDIITADVDEAFYVPRREEIKREKTTGALELALQELSRQEAALVASLLGEKASSSQVAVESPLPPRILVKPKIERDLERPVSMPLILQPADMSSMKISDAQAAIIDELRQDFIQGIGGTNQDPGDPEYLRRWQAAQRKADDMLVGMLGRNFVINYEKQLDQAMKKEE